MPRKSSPLCPKCGQPRHKSAGSGKLQPFCHEHMQEYWRERNYHVNHKLRYSDSEPASTATSPSAVLRVVHSKNGAGRCGLCHRTPQQAAIFALCARVWCSACTPEGLPQTELLCRFVPMQVIPVTKDQSEVAEGDSDRDAESLRLQLQDALRELRVLREAVNAPLAAWEHYS